MSNQFHQKPKQDDSDATDESMDLAASSNSELRRVTVDPSGGLPQDSAVIPNIEAWLHGRSKTDEREILKNSFDETEFTA